ncbi:MAG: hypothetical protein II707_07730, partial [Spirochaetales bacterium]|nr:hypothetical protein [Spirochaetales bacterium]
MKKIKFIIFCLLLDIVLCGVAVAQTRIAVLPFTSEEKLSRAVLTYLTDVFTVEMVNSNDFVVVERAKLDAALKEMKFQSGEMFDESTAVELGKMSGAEMVFFGTIFLFGGRNVLSIKGMDIKTATLKYAKQANGETDVQLESAVKTIASQITKDETGGTSSKKGHSDNSGSGRTGRLSKPEQQFHDKYIVDKWGISASNKDDMQYYYKVHKAGGRAMAVAGPVMIFAGIMVTSVLCSVQEHDGHRSYVPFENILIGSVLGSNLMTGGVIITA